MITPLDSGAAARPGEPAAYGAVIVVYPDGREEHVALHRPTNRLGSHQDNEVVITDAAVQPYHASLLYGAQGFEVLDFGAGVLVDGVPASSSEPLRAADDAVLQIGPVRVFLYPPAQPVGPPPSLATLVVQDASGHVRALPVLHSPLRAGSASDNDLLIDAPNTPAYVATITITGNSAVLRDLTTNQETPMRGWVDLAPLRVAVFAPDDLEGLRAALAAPPAIEVAPTSAAITVEGTVLEPDPPPTSATAPAAPPQPPAADSTPAIEPESAAEATPRPATRTRRARSMDALLGALATEDASPAAATQPLDNGALSVDEVVDALTPAATPEAQPGNVEAAAEADLVDLVDHAAALARQPAAEPAPEAPPEPAPLNFGTLVVVFPDKQRRSAPLPRPTLRIGRAPGNDVIIEHPDCAPHHFQLFCDPPNYQVLDLDTRQGTLVDEARTTPYVPFTLNPDSVIRLGALRVFVYPPDVALEPLPELPTSQALARLQPTAPQNVSSQTDLQLSASYLRVEPGSNATLRVQLTNHTPVLDHLSVAIEGLDPGWVGMSTTTLPLFPGTQDELTLTLTPPRAAASLAGRHTFTVVARSEHHPELALRAEALLDIQPFTELAVAIFPPRQSAARKANYQAEVLNKSNHRVRVALAFGDPQGVFNQPFQSREIWLEPGNTYRIQLNVSVRAGVWLFGRRGAYPFVISAQTLDQQLVEAQGEFTLLPRWQSAPPPPPPRASRALPAPPSALSLPAPRQLSPRVRREAPPAASRQPAAALAPAARQPAAEAPVAAPLEEFEPAFVTITPAQLTVDAGGAATATLALVNRATIVDRISMEVQGVPASWVTVTPDSLSLLPNARSEAQLIISPPRSPQSSAGTMRLHITARSEKRPDRPALLNATLVVRPFNEWRQALMPAERKGYRRGAWSLEVQNRGNQPQEFTFSGQDSEAALNFEFQPTRLIIPAGEAQRVQVRARAAKGNWIGQAQLLPFLITTTPDGNEDLAQQAPGRLLQKAVLPGWIAQIVLPFMLLALAIVLMFGRTAVRDFISGIFGKSTTSAPTAAPTTDPAASNGDATGGTGGATTPAGPAVSLEGAVHWTATDNPVLLDSTYIISPGSSLQIDPGVEVQLAAGASLEIQGTLQAVGEPGVPITFSGVGGANWDSIRLIRGAQATISNARITNGGSSGTVFLAQSATVKLEAVDFISNTGGLLGYNSNITLTSVQMNANQFGTRPALGFQLLRGNQVVLDGVRVENNTVASSAASVHMVIEQIGASFDIRNTLVRQDASIGLLIQASETYDGAVGCSTFAGHRQALIEQFNATVGVARLTIEQSALEGQQAPSIATPAQLNANWWGNAAPASASNSVAAAPSCAPQ